MARTVNRVAIAAELAALEVQIGELRDQAPLEGVRLKFVRPSGTAGKPSQEKGYPRLIQADGSSRNIADEQVTAYQSRINAARELRRLVKRQSDLLVKVEG